MNRRNLLKLTALSGIFFSVGWKMKESETQKKDALIIGGGPAGLSCALTLARGGRSVFVVDNNQPRNAPALHMQNFPSRDGTPPAEFKKQILKDLEKYEHVQILNQEVVDLKEFKLTTSKGIIEFKKLVLAYGVLDLLPEIPGLKNLWGKSVFHCPYCHGYEYRNTPMALMGNHEYLHHMTPLVYGLSQDIIVFSHGEKLPDELKEKLLHKKIKFYEEKVVSFHTQGENLQEVELEGGKKISRNYLFMRPMQKPKSPLGEKLGCELTPQNLYVVDDFGRTTVKNVYAAGDIAVLRQSVLNASASGSNVGASVNFDLQSENF
mgnify:CR=1 FL=1